MSRAEVGACGASAQVSRLGESITAWQSASPWCVKTPRPLPVLLAVRAVSDGPIDRAALRNPRVRPNLSRTALWYYCCVRRWKHRVPPFLAVRWVTLKVLRCSGSECMTAGLDCNCLSVYPTSRFQNLVICRVRHEYIRRATGVFVVRPYFVPATRTGHECLE